MKKIPTVNHGKLESEEEIIELSSNVWHEWLSVNTSFRYEPISSQPGFTARVEKSDYWYAYRKVQGKLHKRYIGKVKELTQERLEEISVLLNEPAQPRQPKVIDKVTQKISVTQYATNKDIGYLWEVFGLLQEKVERLQQEVALLKSTKTEVTQSASVTGSEEMYLSPNQIAELQKTFESNRDSDYRVELINENLVATYTPYDESGKFQNKCKSLGGHFDHGDRSWRFPVRKVESVISRLTDDRFYVSPEVKAAVANLQRQRDEEKALKKAIALSQSQEIIKLVKAANLDAPLANGWNLRNYQKRGVEWLLAHRKGGIYGGGILADDMGLGKSLTALCAAKAMQYLYSCVVIVVSPVSLIEGWGRFAEIAEVMVEMFSNNYQKIPTPLENQKYTLICDEAHCFQDIKSQRTEKILALAHHENCLATWMLTGTPIKNGRPINLMPLLMAVQHPLVENKSLYQRRYCKGHRKSVSQTRTAWDTTGAAHLKELAQKTQDVILRRKKSEVLAELPPKTRLFREVDLEPEVEKEYRSKIENLAQDYRQRVKQGEVDANAEALVRLNTIRKEGSCAKVPFAVTQAQEILEQGQSVVIFTEFLDSAKAIHSQLMTLEMGRCELLTGETKVEERQVIVDRFQSGESKVFIGTIKAGGVGLTLTASSHVLLVDRPWTPGDAEQAEDRCHRDSQQNAVFAIWLQLGEVDKAIDNLLLQKSHRIDLVLQGKRQTLRGINSPQELAKELLAIL